MPNKAVTDWDILQQEYVQGRMTLDELAQTHCVKPDTVRKQATRHKWGAKRLEFQQVAIAKAAEQASIERVTDLIAFNRDDLKVARAIRARVARRLGEPGVEIPSIELRQLAAAAVHAQRIGRLALGASTDNVVPPTQPTDPIGDEDGAPTMDEYLQARARAIDDF